jgi:exosortase A
MPSEAAHSAGALTDSPFAPLRPAVPALVLGLGLLGLLFQREVLAAYGVWTTSTAYGHCFFVLPLAAYLAWDRRAVLAGLAPRPLPWAALAMLPLGAGWLLAERMSLMEGRQLMAVAMIDVLALAVLGWRVTRAMAAPLLYLFFLVPFGAFLTSTLQDVTTWFIRAGLSLTDIPFFIDNRQIEIPEGRFYVAEACAGLRFLIAAVAFGVLYACLMFRSAGRRAVFIGVSIVVPIIANGFRALGIVVLGHILGSAEAAAADHIIYGWGFFSVVILLLVVAGLPFREDHLPWRAAPADGAAPAGGAALLASVAAACALAAAGPATAVLFDRAAAAETVAAPALPAGVPPGCSRQGSEEAGGRLATHYVCNRIGLTLTLERFPAHASPATILASLRALTAEFSAEDVFRSPLPLDRGSPRAWNLVEIAEPPHLTATALWVDDAPAVPGISGRLAMALGSIIGAAPPVVLAAVTAEPGAARLTPQGRTMVIEAMRGLLQGSPEVIRAAAGE